MIVILGRRRGARVGHESVILVLYLQAKFFESGRVGHGREVVLVGDMRLLLLRRADSKGQYLLCMLEGLIRLFILILKILSSSD